MTDNNVHDGETPGGPMWALVLGASSGFGAAMCVEFAGRGLSVFGVHLDRKALLPSVERIAARIESLGVQARFFNINAADHEKREQTLDEIGRILGEQGGELKALAHSLAFGSIRPFWSEDEEMITPAQVEMTLDVMASSLVYWTQGILRRGLMKRGGRIVAMTSAGGTHVWPRYGAVSAAKAALEANCRQLAYELAPLGITCNAVRAGVTDTPALRKITDYERMVEFARGHNPSGRLTTPEDVARVVSLLIDERSQWMTGSVINVDGGEYIAD